MQQLSKPQTDSLFESIIDPSPLAFLTNQVVEVFLESYWEKEHFHIEPYEDDERKEFLQSLFNKQVLHRHMYDMHSPLIMGIDISTTDDNLAEFLPTEKTIKYLLKMDRTIYINQPQRFNDNLWRLIAGLEDELGCLVSCTVHLSKPNVQITTPKHKNAKIFIIQTQGTTVWTLKGKKKEDESEIEYEEDEEEVEFEVTLQAGDVLYIPRGMQYEVESISGNEHNQQYFVQLVTYCDWSCADLALGAVKTLTQGFVEEQEISDECFQGLPLGIITQTHPFHSMATDQDATFNFYTLQQKISQSLRQMADIIENSDKLIPKSVHDFSRDFFESRLPPHPKQIRTSCPNSPYQEIIKLGNFFRIIPPEETNQIKENQILLFTTIQNNRNGHMMFGVQRDEFFLEEKETALSADADGFISGSNADSVFAMVKKIADQEKNNNQIQQLPKKRKKYLPPKLRKAYLDPKIRRIAKKNHPQLFQTFAEHDKADESIQQEQNNLEINEFELQGVEIVSNRLIFDAEYLAVLKQIIMMKRHEKICINNLTTPKNLPDEKLQLAKILWNSSIFGVVSEDEGYLMNGDLA